jgi:hypothetical protein
MLYRFPSGLRRSAIKYRILLLVTLVFISSPLFARKKQQNGNQTAATAATTPAVAYSTYVGRTSADIAHSIAVGPDGSVYVTGLLAPTRATQSHNEAFVAHIAADGATVLYMLTLGGNGDTEARAIAIDSAGNAYVTGETRASDFPAKNALHATCSLNATRECSGDAFLTKLNPDGSIAFSTYLGGSGEDGANAIARDPTGNIYIAGATSSTDFPVFKPLQSTSGGDGDAFIAKIAGDGSRVLYATYFGGRGIDEARGIAVDAAGNAYVTGVTQSTDFPTAKAIQSSCKLDASKKCNGEAFVAKISGDGSSLAYSTYLGGSGGDAGNAIAVDLSGNAFITGSTSSKDFPVENAFQLTALGPSAAFLTKITPGGASLGFSTYLAGGSSDQGLAVSIDTAGNIFVAGETYSAAFPLANALQSACRPDRNGACSGDAFVAVFDPTGSHLEFGTYLGGSAADQARGIALDSQNAVYLAGATSSLDFPFAKAAQFPRSSTGTPGNSSGSAGTTVSSATIGGAFTAKISGMNGIIGGKNNPSVSSDPPTNCTGTTTNWLGGAGNWSNAANWSTGVVPNSVSTNVCIDDGNAANSQVTLDISVSVGTLTIDSGDSLIIGDGLQFVAAGNISNSGQITVSAGAGNAFLSIQGPVSLSGGGTLTLATTGAGAAIIRANCSCGAQLTNVDNTIEGFGTIGNNGLPFINQAGGTVNANVPGGNPLFINTAADTNLGLLEATAGGTLQLNPSSITNQNGNITSSGSGSTVQLVSVTIQGGTLTSSGGAVLGVPSGNTATLDGSTAAGQVTLVGTYTIADGSSTVVLGTISNTGTILLNANTNNTFLDVQGPVNLTGAGTLTLATSGSAPPIVRANCSCAAALTNVNNTIQGTGTIGNNGLPLLNQGIIDANVPAATLFVNAPLTNPNLMEATNGGILQILSTTDNNLGGTIVANGAGSQVQLVGATIQGGTLNTTAGGLLSIPAGNSSTLDGTAQGTINNKGVFTVANGSVATLIGTINNTNAILLNAVGNSTFLQLNGPVTLTGGGTVTMSTTGSGPAIINAACSCGAQLTNVNNIIQGVGTIGQNGLPVINQAAGVIDANVPGTNTLFVNTPTTNLGLMEATAGGTLQLLSSTFINATATITSSGSGSTVQLVSATIQGGTLSSSGGAVLGLPAGNSSTLDGSTPSGQVTLVGTFTIANGSNTDLLGTINNTGTILLSATTNNTFMEIQGPVTLTGKGTVTMSGSGTGQAIINAACSCSAALTNVNNTIQGTGQIGNNGLPVTNQGTILANATTPLNMNPGSLTNQGLIEAISGGTLQLTNGIVNNSAGTIEVSGATSAVQFASNVTIQGGTLTTANNGVLGAPAATSMTLDGATLGKLTNSGTFTIADGAQVTALGTLNNTGAIQINAVANTTFLHINGPVSVTGGGTVTLVSTASAQAIVNAACSCGAVLTNANNTFQGAGQIGNNGLPVTNQGTILANAALPLTVNPGSLTNAGLLEATSGGTLQLTNGVINNAAGTIEVNGATSAVQFANNVTIQGGTLATLNNGVLGAPANSSMTLDGTSQGVLTNSGTFTVADNSSVTMLGTINNIGVIQVNAISNSTFLHINGPVIFTGAGIVSLATTGTGQAIINAACSCGAVLTNAGNLIQGTGQLGNNGLPVINMGTINANATAPLTVNPGALTNQGLMEATAGGVLQIANASINNAAGTIEVNGATSAVQFVNNVTIQAGTLTTANNGVLGVPTGNSMTLDGSTAGILTNAGTFTIADNGTVTVLGTINNTGAIQINAVSNNTFMSINGPVSLTGAGTVTLSSAGAVKATINAACSCGAVLTNVGNVIQGFGVIGENGLPVINQGTIDANNAAGPLFVNPGTLTNQGLIEATAGGSMQLPSATIPNNGGTISVNGATSSIELLSGTTIQGGTVTTANNGVLGSAAETTITLDGTANALTIGAGGTFTVEDGSTTNILGTINNLGTLLVDSTGDPTSLTIPAGAVATLTGGGTLTTTNSANTIGGASLVNSGNVIHDLAVMDVNSFSQTSGSIQIAASGTATIPAFAVSGGVAQIDGTLTVSGGLSVPTGGTLSGIGQIVSNVTSTGITQGGDNPAPGILSISGGAADGFTQGAAGAFDVVIGGTTAGTQFSQVNASGAVSLAGTLNVTLINGFTPAAGNQFTILNAASVARNFTSVNVPGLTGNLAFNVVVNATSVVLTVTNSSATLVSIAVTPANQSVAAGTQQQFTATGTFSDNSTQNLTNSVTWASSDTTIATVSAAGLATTLQKAGTTSISAQQGNIIGKTNLTVTTTATLVSIAVTPPNQSVVAGTPVQFTATGTFSDNSTQNLTNSVTWVSSDTTIATISAAGLATTLQKAGTTSISAQQGNIIGKTNLTVTVAPTFTLTVNTAGSGAGTVTSDKGGINCPEACSATFAQGTVVTLTAVANSNSTFTGWSSPCTGTGTCVVTMNSNQTATATFILGNQPVLIGPAPGGSTTATVNPGGTAVFPLVLTSTGFTGTVTLTCSSPVTTITCNVIPGTAQITGTSTTHTAIAVNTFCSWMAPPSSGRPENGPGGRLIAVWAIALLAAMSLFGIAAADPRRRLKFGMPLAFLALVALFGAACGSPAKGPNGLTPPGTYPLTITATPSSGAPSSIVVTLTVL